MQSCHKKEDYFTQRLDHYVFPRGKEATFMQRYVLCPDIWRRGNPIFFYAGNEGSLETYVRSTGLMWENAPRFGAMLLFAEHRYYGKSQPFGSESWKIDPRYLTTEQALADYATLVQNIKHRHDAQDSPVIVFGGSYGGELAAWMRLKYPHIVAGAIAASAPVLGFPDEPGFNPSNFWKIVTRDATPAAGAAAGCSANVHRVFAMLVYAKETEFADISKGLRLCKPLAIRDDVTEVAYWLQGAFDAYAMGNYPYPSSYINGDDKHPLPAWPMRAACQLMTQGHDLLSNMADAVGLLYNASHNSSCYSTASSAGPATGGDLGPWDFQVCSEQVRQWMGSSLTKSWQGLLLGAFLCLFAVMWMQMAQEQPYWPANGRTDMFWDQGSFNFTAISEHCQAAWGLMGPNRPNNVIWPTIQFGGLEALKQTSNIVFSNGEYDPWSAYGVRQNLSATVHAIFISEGAHHLDLMWNHANDPSSVRNARKFEVEQIAIWTKQAVHYNSMADASEKTAVTR